MNIWLDKTKTFFFNLSVILWVVLITLLLPGCPARLEKFSVSYLSDRYSRSGFQELGLLWSGQRGQISHNAVQQLSICQQRATVLLSCIMACRYSTSSVRSSSAARLHSCFREESSIGSVTDESCCCHGTGHTLNDSPSKVNMVIKGLKGH